MKELIITLAKLNRESTLKYELRTDGVKHTVLTNGRISFKGDCINGVINYIKMEHKVNM